MRKILKNMKSKMLSFMLVGLLMLGCGGVMEAFVIEKNSTEVSDLCKAGSDKQVACDVVEVNEYAVYKYSTMSAKKVKVEPVMKSYKFVSSVLNTTCGAVSTNGTGVGKAYRRKDAKDLTINLNKNLKSYRHINPGLYSAKRTSYIKAFILN